MEVIIIIILIVALSVSIYLNINQSKKLDQSEDYIEALEIWFFDLDERSRKIVDGIKEVDRKGLFEADDEVGWIFKELKDLIETLTKIKEGENENKIG